MIITEHPGRMQVEWDTSCRIWSRTIHSKERLINPLLRGTKCPIRMRGDNEATSTLSSTRAECHHQLPTVVDTSGTDVKTWSLNWTCPWWCLCRSDNRALWSPAWMANRASLQWLWRMCWACEAYHFATDPVRYTHHILVSLFESVRFN